MGKGYSRKRDSFCFPIANQSATIFEALSLARSHVQCMMDLNLNKLNKGRVQRAIYFTGVSVKAPEIPEGLTFQCDALNRLSLLFSGFLAGKLML